MISYVIEDIISVNRKTIYAKKGDCCTIINRSGKVVICLHENGSRFSCLDTQLSNLKIQKNVERITKHKGKG